ncbi:MAG: CHAT domain-containing protein [Desulfobacteraceae bacterium]|nr:CHAT domain-containing protein [Desulfobacteraceae bacterium]
MINKLFQIIVIVYCILATTALLVHAQVILDGTMGISGKLQGPDYDIKTEYGKQAGTNLFHSFSEFNIDTGESATFSGPASVRNIISRITGGRFSWIDGTLHSTISGADLYLLNPAGVMFGPNALLDIGGSFHVSTADYLCMGEHEKFFTMPLDNEILSISPPTAFGFLDNNVGKISIEGKGKISQAECNMNLKSGLTVQDSKTISVIGGDIDITNGTYCEIIEDDDSDDIASLILNEMGRYGNINAHGGRINIASVSSAGEVIPTEDGLEVSSFDKMGKIAAYENSLVSVIGQEEGSIFIRGGEFFLDNSVVFFASNNESNTLDIDVDTLNLEGSYILAGTLSDGGDITIRASESVNLSGNNKYYGYSSSIASGVYNTSTYPVSAGNILVETKKLSLNNGASVFSISLGENGKAGNINLEVANLELNDNCIIKSESNSPDMKEEDKITINGRDHATESIKLSENSHIETINNSKGNAGSINIEVVNLGIENRSQIRSYTKKDGDAGSITISAKDSPTNYINLKNYGGISTETGGKGKAGTIELEVNNLELFNSSAITSSSYSTGEGGNAGIINISAKNLPTSYIILKKTSSIATESRGEGRAGIINLDVSHLELTGGSNITSSNYSPDMSGEAGRITIGSDSIRLNGYSHIETISNGDGNAGIIDIEVVRLELDNNSDIKSDSENKDSDAGSITIGRKIEKNDSGEIISIKPSDSVRILDNSYISTTAENAGGGKISIHAKDEILLQHSNIKSDVKQGDRNGGDITIGSHYTKKVGQPERSQFVILDQSNITANADKGDGGAIFIYTDNYIKSADSKVTATSNRGNEGTIKIDAPDMDFNSVISVLPSNFLDASRWMKPPCSARTGEDVSRFTATSGDGLSLSPDDWQPSPPLSFDPLDPEDKTEQLILNGEKLYYEGKYKNAAQTWEKALTLSDKSKETYLHTLICLANAYKNIGHHQKAFFALHNALPFIKANKNSYHDTLFLNTLGQLSFCSGKTDFSNSDDFSSVFENMKNAETILEKALEKARTANDSRILAAILNNIGNVLAADRAYKDYEGVMSHYKEALQLIEYEPFPESPILKTKILINTARLSFQTEHYEEAVTALDNILLQAENMPDTYNKAADLISAGILAMKIKKKYSQSENRLNPLAYQSLNKAKQIAENLQNPRIASYSCGYLGQFYEQEGQFSEAIAMTRNAIFSAQQEYYPEILYLWQWQLGRLFKTLENSEKAIASYRNAINTLNPIRTEFLKAEHGKFNKEVRPVYLELAEILLKQAQTVQDKESKLREARDIIEHLKIFEIEDFFKDECVTARMKKIRTLDNPPSNTAVLYPISFSDHLELLLILPDSMKQVSVAVDSETLRQNATRFHERLKDLWSARFQYYAEELYEDLIDPIENILISQEINTLIIAPDGILRLIPFSALHDGTQYLIEKYALVTIPAITLTDSEPPEPERTEILLNGLSKASQGFPALPSVTEELEDIKNIMGGRILQDEGFTEENLKSELRNHEYTVVHMATHGKFGGSPQNTFLLTYNSRLTMNELEDFIGIGRFRDTQVNLLTLSACQTAQGDERSALGLAGVAVKAGVKSAIATLWFVDDKAASLAVKELYRQLDSGISKAKALQNAQKKLISHSDYNHPAYWAPFLLIGNWM